MSPWNEELADGKREPNLMKNNPSNPVISKLSRGKREIFNRLRRSRQTKEGS